VNAIEKARRPPIHLALLEALRLRCPYCRQARVLARWPNKMRKECRLCGLSFFREPGYYVGGMIITYGLMVLIVVPTFFFAVLMPDWKTLSDNLWFALWLLFAIPLSLLLMPYGYSLWLHLDFWLEPWTPQEPPYPDETA
jgi:uncharacterized protein (DUF983 family)